MNELIEKALTWSLKYYPNKDWHDNCGKDVHRYHRRINTATPKTKWDCFRGRHIRHVKDVHIDEPTTYHCKHCYVHIDPPTPKY